MFFDGSAVQSPMSGNFGGTETIHSVGNAFGTCLPGNGVIDQMRFLDDQVHTSFMPPQPVAVSIAAMSPIIELMT